MNRTWHAEHFCCSKCKEMITKNQYTTEKEKPICLSCHAIHFAEECEGCGKKIVIGEKRVSHGKKHWHDECFICEKCGNTLVLGSFNIADEKVVCRQCYGQNKSKLCCKCGVEIKVKNQWIDYNNQYYHSACFCCQSCHQPISSGFMEHEESFYCTACYQILFSQKCARCGLPVTGNGVTYSDQVWHTSCFDCFCCRQPISSHKFREHSGDRYCNDCYEKMFRKECHSCCELIKDDAYFTTDDLFWHNGCLTCANCQKDLGSIGFHMVEQETYCSECAEKVY